MAGGKKDVAEQTKRLLIELNINEMYRIFFGEACLDEEKASAEASALVEFIRGMETCSLTDLRFEIYYWYDPYWPKRFQEEIFGFITRMVQCNCIRDLELWGDFPIVRFPSIVEALSRNSTIQNLEISSHFGKEGATAIAEMLHSETISLKSLLLDNSKMGDEGCRAVVEALCAYPALKVLKMSDCDIGIEGAKSIRKFLRSSKCTIEELRIPMNPRISDKGCVAVMEGLLENSSIKVLGMESCEIGKEGVEAIANVLSSGKCAVEELSVDGNNGIKDEGCVLIMEALRNNNSICKLVLSDCGIGDEGMKSIAHVLQNDHGACLRSLSLSQNLGIGLEGFKALANALYQNSSLENLDLSECHLCVQGCIDLMDALSENSSIKSINLGCCKIGNEGGKAVANFLKSNTGSIQELNLDGNSLDEESLVEIANALYFNTHLTKLSLGHMGQEKEIWITFCDASHCNYYLQELDMWAYEHRHQDYKSKIEKNLDDNKKLGPVKAEMHKTGLFPCHILPCLTTASCFVEALSKVASLEHLSPLFDLVCERPMFFDFNL